MLTCAICGATEEASLVPHIREHHDLKQYLAIYPDLPVVVPSLFTAIENAVYFKYEAGDTPDLSGILSEEREIILVTRKNNQPLRSEITVIPDF